MKIAPLPSRVYDVLKYVALVVLPAIGALYYGLSQIWGLPEADKVVGSIVVIDTFIGALINLSNKAYNASDERFDGEVLVSGTGDEKDARLVFNEHPVEMADKKKELTFKVKHVSAAKKTAKRLTKTARNVKVEEKA